MKREYLQNAININNELNKLESEVKILRQMSNTDKLYVQNSLKLYEVEIKGSSIKQVCNLIIKNKEKRIISLLNSLSKI